MKAKLASLETEALGGLRGLYERLGVETGERERGDFDAHSRLNARFHAYHCTECQILTSNNPCSAIGTCRG